uniref:Polysaccharide chain length determinant N-terminal domain-containing protein n=1 Tax=mine drainage metagenome TaxID=410659 RepID=E6PYQ4_9ZZZZ
MTKFPSSNTNQFADNPIRVADVARLIRKYGIYVLGSTMLGAILFAMWAHFQPSLYDATAMIHLDQHSSISLGPSGATGDEYGLKIQTQIIGLRNPDVAISTMKKLKLSQNPIFNPSLQQDLDNPASRDRLVNVFLGSLKIARVPQTELISVTFRSRNPVLSAIVVNTLVDEYFEESFEQRYKSTQDISRYLTTRLESLESKIQNEQNELMTSGLKLGIIDIGSGSSSTSGTSSIGTSTLVVETSGLLDQRVKAQADLYLAEAEYQNLLVHPDAVPPIDVPGSLEMSSLVTSLSTANGQLASIEQRYGSNYPGLGQVQAQVKSYEHDIADLHAKLLQSAKQNVDRAQSVVDSLNNRINSLKQQSEGATPEIVHYEVLKSQYMSDQTLYNVLLSTLGTGEIQAGMQTQVLNRFVTADVPGTRAFPRVGLTGIAGGAGGMVVSLLIISILVFSSDTVETIEQIEESLPVPILASVPEYRDELASRSSGEKWNCIDNTAGSTFGQRRSISSASNFDFADAC